MPSEGSRVVIIPARSHGFQQVKTVTTQTQPSFTAFHSFNSLKDYVYPIFRVFCSITCRFSIKHNFQLSFFRNKQNPDQQILFYYKLRSPCSSSLVLPSCESYRDFTILPVTFTKYFSKFPTYLANNISSPVNVPNTESEHQLRVSCVEHPAGSLEERTAETQSLWKSQQRRKPASRATGTDQNWCSKDLGFWFIALLSQVNGRTVLTGAFLVTEQCYPVQDMSLQKQILQEDSRLHFAATKLKF